LTVKKNPNAFPQSAEERIQIKTKENPKKNHFACLFELIGFRIKNEELTNLQIELG